MTVETVQKVAKGAQKQGPILPHFKSDATKVTSKGMGLKKAYLNKHNQFTVHAGDAGMYNFFSALLFSFLFSYNEGEPNVKTLQFSIIQRRILSIRAEKSKINNQFTKVNSSDLRRTDLRNSEGLF